MLADVLKTVAAGDLWVADRNFCVISFLFGINLSKAFFAIRQHGNLPFTPLGKEKAAGQIDSGKVFEQKILVVDKEGNELKLRRIRINLKTETRDGDKDIFIIANLPKSSVHAKQISMLYSKRWRIETAFQELTEHFNCEINTLGYPPAALFGFCVALVAYIILAVVKASLSSVYGAEKIDNEVSGYYIADEISATYRGMMIAVPEEEWLVFSKYTQSELVAVLIELATNVKLKKIRKHPRGPKKPAPKRKSDPKHPHVSTARIIAKRKKR